MSELKVQNLRRTFGSVVALEDISFDVAEGEFFCLLGASSFGKTTILRSIAGLEELAGGAVHFGGQVDFAAIFSKMAANNFDGWAVVEWECALKHSEDGAREGAAFVREHVIHVTERAFDDFADSGTDEAANRKMLGINRWDICAPCGVLHCNKQAEKDIENARSNLRH
jgi:ABC-type transporter Mla maintaining outer membrane lipid asymmetry ATPase subunit MlaF